MLSCQLGLFGQSAIDSMEALLKQDLHDTVRVTIYAELSEMIVEEERWSMYNQMALELSEANLPNDDPAQEKVFLFCKGSALSNKGFLYHEKGDVENALKYYYESLDYFKKAGKEHESPATLSNIGLLFSDQGDYEDALQYLEKGLKIREENGDIEGSTTLMINIAYVYEETGDTLSAIELYRKAVRICLEYGDHENAGAAYNNIGTLHYNTRQKDSALYYMRKSLHHYTLSEDPSGIAWANANIGQNHFQNGQYDSSLFYNNRSYRIAQQLGYPELSANVSANLYQLWKHFGNADSALKYYEIHIKMEETMFNVDTQKEALRLKLANDHELEKAEIHKEQEIKDAIDAERDRQKSIYFWLVTIGLLIVVVFAFVLAQRLKVTREQKDVIEQQKAAVTEQKEIIEEKNNEITDSIAYAKRLQDAILPPKRLMAEALPSHFVMYQPKELLSGDFYWVEPDGDHVWFAVVDCTGHGVPGAMVSVVGANGLNRCVREFKLQSPGEVLDKLSMLVTETFHSNNSDSSELHVRDGMDMSICRLNRKNNQLMCAGANNSVFLIRNGDVPLPEGAKVHNIDGKQLIEIKADKQSIGGLYHTENYTTHTIILHPGDQVYQFTDGYPDQFGGEKGKKFRYNRFRELLVRNAGKTTTEQHHALQTAFEQWKGDLEQIDDVCVFGIKIT